MRFTCPVCAAQLNVEARCPPTAVCCPACGHDTPVPTATEPAEIGKVSPGLQENPDCFSTIMPAPNERRPTGGGLPPPGYEIDKVLGRGATGIVYQARQEKTNRVVALKLFLDSDPADADELARLRRETAAIVQLRHPGIVQVFEVGEHEGKPFYSMELCSGSSLDRLLSLTSLPPRESAVLIETLAGAMQAAHDAGVVHRNLKPANVMFAGQPGQLPKLTDFGLAKQLDGAGQSAKCVDVLSYLAPEKAQRHKCFGPLAAVYSLGAILYECLTERPPFRAGTTLETLQQVANQEPVPVRQLRASVPVDLETICHKCLQKEPGKRYGSAQALADDLRRYLDGKPIVARPAGRGGRLLRWCNRNPIVAWVLARVSSAKTEAPLTAAELDPFATVVPPPGKGR